MPMNEFSENDTLIIDGKEVQSFTTDLECSWINYDAYMGATMEINGQEFDILILKTDFERLKGAFNANN